MQVCVRKLAENWTSTSVSLENSRSSKVSQDRVGRLSLVDVRVEQTLWEEKPGKRRRLARAKQKNKNPPGVTGNSLGNHIIKCVFSIPSDGAIDCASCSVQLAHLG